MEVDSAPQPTTKKPDQVESADLLIGVLADIGAEEMSAACETLRTLPGAPRTLILRSHVDPKVDAASAENTSASSVSVLPWVLDAPGTLATPVETTSAAYTSLFEMSEKLGARGCCVIASKLEDTSSDWIRHLTEPLFALGSDMVAPCYSSRKYEGLLNHSIIGPLTRSLYGKRIQNPMGPDLALSERLVREALGANHNGRAVNSGMHLLASLAPIACYGDFQVHRAYLGTRIYPPVDWTNVSSLLAEILGPVFLNMEKNAARWQRIRNSTPVETLNRRTSALATTKSVEVGRLVNSFQLGTRDLVEIWGLVLPPAILFELKKLSRLSAEAFHMPDDVWARIIYDFALAHRLQKINRDHLLRSLTPLYLGWVASYAREVEAADNAAVAQRLERLALVYEAEKPYLISRWRWPDRFNP